MSVSYDIGNFAGVSQLVSPALIDASTVLQWYDGPHNCPIETLAKSTETGYNTATGWLVQICADQNSNRITNPPSLVWPYVGIRRTQRTTSGWFRYFNPLSEYGPSIWHDPVNPESNYGTDNAIATYYDYTNQLIAVVTSSALNPPDATAPTGYRWSGQIQFSYLDVSDQMRGVWNWIGPALGTGVVDHGFDFNGMSGRIYLLRTPNKNYLALYHDYPTMPKGECGDEAGLSAVRNSVSACTINHGVVSGSTPAPVVNSPFVVFPVTTHVSWGIAGMELDGSGVVHFFAVRYTMTPVNCSASPPVVTYTTDLCHRTWDPVSLVMSSIEVIPGVHINQELPDTATPVVKWPLWDGTQFFIPVAFDEHVNTGASHAQGIGFIYGNTGSWTLDTDSLMLTCQNSEWDRSDKRQLWAACECQGDIFVLLGLALHGWESTIWPGGPDSFEFDHIFWTRRDKITGQWDPIRKLFWVQEDNLFQSTSSITMTLKGNYVSHDQQYDSFVPTQKKAKFAASFVMGLNDFVPVQDSDQFTKSYYPCYVAQMTYEIPGTTTPAPSEEIGNSAY